MLREAFIWIAIPAVNFYIFFLYSKARFGGDCARLTPAPLVVVEESRCPPASPGPEEREWRGSGLWKCGESSRDDSLLLSVETSEFDVYRAKQLAPALNEYGDTLILQLPLPGEGPDAADLTRCTGEVLHHFASSGDNGQCFAVAMTDSSTVVTKGTIILRFDQSVDSEGHLINDPNAPKKVIDLKLEAEAKSLGNASHNFNHLRPAGHFRRVPKVKGFARVYEKLFPFLKNLDGPNGMAQQLQSKLDKHGIKRGDDLVVMVVNEGEVDLFLNFACSCRLHNLSLNNMLVFSGSPEITDLIESTGAIALFHEGYASVSKAASVDYLDRVFVDMMWYKAFSVYLLLRLRINVLFQDVDLVWFRDPFPYFHKKLAEDKSGGNTTDGRGSGIKAFFTDDGNRSKRYSPLFFNSGFYYLVASAASEYFSWSIMTAFDAVQVTGSHQNVFTLRLVESFALGPQNAQILSLDDFPNGILYHHNRGYMKLLRQGKVQPYHFHMCWTQGKPDKLKYLRLALMWYLTDTCSPLESLIPKGSVFEENAKTLNLPIDQRWNALSSKCCTSMKGAP